MGADLSCAHPSTALATPLAVRRVARWSRSPSPALTAGEGLLDSAVPVSMDDAVGRPCSLPPGLGGEGARWRVREQSRVRREVSGASSSRDGGRRGQGAGASDSAPFGSLYTGGKGRGRGLG